jgi:hypothetical protein
MVVVPVKKKNTSNSGKCEAGSLIPLAASRIERMILMLMIKREMDVRTRRKLY